MKNSYGLSKSLISTASEILRESSGSKYEKYAKFDGMILVLGYGSVGQAIVPLILRHLKVNPSNITILEKDNHQEFFDKRHGDTKIKYVPDTEIVKENYEKILSRHVNRGGLIVNCSLNIDAITLLKWCIANDVMQIDTSLERWGNEFDEDIPNPGDRTLYMTHKEMDAVFANTKGKATCCVTSGANPGMITSLVKRALLKLAEMQGKKVKEPRTQEEWAQLSKSLEVHVIQCSEYDSQVTDTPRKLNEFQNTWSVEGFWAESRAPSEFGAGTHEPKPGNGRLHKDKTAGYLLAPGAATYVKSWAPYAKEFNGFLVQHSEAITISKYLTTHDNSYRPTVYYAYRPADFSVASMHDLRGKELDTHAKHTVLKDEIVSGMDELGALLIGPGFALWHGSHTTIEDARKLLPGESATSIQVAGHMIATIVWMINNPNEGYVEPEALPHEEILAITDQYWAPIATVMSDWNPQKKVNKLFDREYNKENPFCLDNFRVWK